MLKDFQNIYARMSDALSREIYIDRLSYSVTHDRRYLEKMVDETLRTSTQWRMFCGLLQEEAVHSELYIFGAGIWGNILYQETRDLVRWKAVIDSFPDGKIVGNLPVIPAQNLREFRDGNRVIVISSYKKGGEISALLHDAGIHRDRIIDAGIVIDRLTEGAIYFDLEQLNPRLDYEVFVDAGCLDGLTTKGFLRWCKGNGYAYCFEPDSKNIGTVLCTLSNDAGRYELVEKALWSETTTLAINARGNSATSVFQPDGETQMPRVEAIALDDFWGNKEVTFIKMDIEGAETDALLGARKIITEQKPKLAISIYHKIDDILTIPRLILQCNPDYRFYLRHYSFSDYDTVLYAI